MTVNYFLYAVLILFGGAAYGQTTDKYTLEGNIADVKNNEQVFLLKRNLKTGAFDTVSKAMPKGGKFVLTGTIPYPDLFSFGASGHQERVPIFLEPVKMSIEGKTLASVKVHGSKSNDEFWDYNKKLRGIDSLLTPLLAKYKEAEQRKDQGEMFVLREEIWGLETQGSAMAHDFVRKHTNSYVSPYVIAQSISEANVKTYSDLFYKLTPSVQFSDMGQAINAYLVKMLQNTLGGIASPIVGKNPQGEVVSLQQVLEQNKYVLIDFWASWCGPCRNENPRVVALYAKYHDKGLGILGVSLDKDEVKWKAAIEKDNLTWPQVSDLQGWSSKFASAYGVNSIPSTFLVDKNGSIIAKNLRGAELEKVIKELLLNDAAGSIK